MSKDVNKVNLDWLSETMRSAGTDKAPRFSAGRARLEAEMTSYEATMVRRSFGGAVAGPRERQRLRALLTRAADTELVEDLRAYFNGRRAANAYIQTPYIVAAARLLACSEALPYHSPATALEAA
jgi:hypothetical protein